MAIQIPCIDIKRVVCQIPIRIVACPAKLVVIVCLVISGHPVNACAAGRNCFSQIVERVELERLLPDRRAAIDVGDRSSARIELSQPGQLVILVVAGVRPARVEAVCNLQTLQCSVGVPIQRSDLRLGS